MKRHFKIRCFSKKWSIWGPRSPKTGDGFQRMLPAWGKTFEFHVKSWLLEVFLDFCWHVIKLLKGCGKDAHTCPQKHSLGIDPEMNSPRSRLDKRKPLLSMSWAILLHFCCFHSTYCLGSRKRLFVWKSSRPLPNCITFIIIMLLLLTRMQFKGYPSTLTNALGDNRQGYYSHSQTG